MSLRLLPKKVSMELAISEFGMDKLSVIVALKTLLMYSLDYDLPIYFDTQITGVDVNTHIGNDYDENYDFIGISVASTDSLLEIDGAKKIERASVFSRANSFISGDENIYISIQMFSKDGMIYKSTSDSGDKLLETTISYERLYFDNGEFSAFKKVMESPDKQTVQSKDTLLHGEVKALALIARDMAEKSNKYKTGNKVNSSAIKNHLIDLAKTYKIPESGLKTLDDKLSKALDKFDIKEITAT